MTEKIEELLMHGKWPDALFESQTLLQFHPTSAKLNGYIGLCHFRMGQFEDAVAPLRTAIKLDETYFDAGLKLVQALDRLMRYDEALATAREIEHLKPSDPTLEHLIKGLQRQVPEPVTDSWQLSTHLDHYQVELTHQE